MPTTRPITTTITITTGAITLAVVIMGTGARREEEGIGTIIRMADMRSVEIIAVRIGPLGQLVEARGVASQARKSLLETGQSQLVR